MEDNKNSGKSLRDLKEILLNPPVTISPQEIAQLKLSYQRMITSYREMFKSYQANTLSRIGIGGKAAAEMADTMKRFEKETVPRYIKAINVLKDNGWSLSPQMDVDDFLGFANDTDDIDSRMSKLYTEGSYKLLLDELDYLRGNLPREFSSVLGEIERTVSDPNSSNVLCFGAMYSVLDYLFVRAVGREFYGKMYMTRRVEILKVLSQLGDPEKQVEYFGYWLKANLVLMADQYHFQVLTQPSAKIDVTRHSVEHGRVDYSKLTNTLLFKLINLASSFSAIGSDLGDYVDLSKV